ncbi:hypothetical protein SKAU_G00349010 [Synaphobranchus kaupii]|uniref:Uncharacterized protein n=1 Tax=Synaphobranchus kaupii TaxID=118154 RepID=A0A9Q1EK46_SYNKA|nr:hypothetical protein SKAU_G00349010 [Synaphobranchus kaupii]
MRRRRRGYGRRPKMRKALGHVTNPPAPHWLLSEMFCAAETGVKDLHCYGKGPTVVFGPTHTKPAPLYTEPKETEMLDKQEYIRKGSALLAAQHEQLAK